MEITKTTTKKLTRLYYICGRNQNDCRCNICDFVILSFRKVYPLSENLDIIEHIKTNHPEYCYKCDKCPDLFTSKADLNRHRKEHKQL